MSIFMVGTEVGTTGKDVHRAYLVGENGEPDPLYSKLAQDVVELIKASTQRALEQEWSLEDYDRHIGRALEALQELTKLKPKAKVVLKNTVKL
jgi:hypothetical protein